ncbi:hypothetical protein FOA43_001444 [Brettanomyces nanus]|uniref:tRNA/rRNA methyltransferase SpoU type domain-containing protein n=1 Tax=Eeniella nana TaxID=13502 RepID=A0A875S207_EENNA|nr:uncharacterized protein FOA43_001444 [Brettanomyces nanus]QPG74122.1 hypothetical protein FOA43_001444 [Brettanomyces nanus]
MVGSMFQLDLSLDSSIYQCSEKLMSSKILFSYDFWSKVELFPLFAKLADRLCRVTDPVLAKQYAEQFSFFTRCVTECLYNENFDITVSKVLKLSRGVLEKLPSSSRDKTFYKTKDKVYGSTMNLLRQVIPLEQVNFTTKESILEYCFEIVDRSEYYSHLGNVQLLSTLLKEYTSITVEDCHRILQIIRLIWQELIKDRLVMKQRDLHHKFIQLLMSNVFLKFSITDKILADDIFDIASQIIDNSSVRKSLLPTLFKCVSDYQVENSESFEKAYWLGRLLVKGAFLYQSDDSIFLMDNVLAREYDKYFNMGDKGVYEQVYGWPEFCYRIWIKAVVSSIKSHQFALTLWDYILANDQVFHLIQPVKRTDHKEQWKRLQLLALMLSTLDIMDTVKLKYYMDKYLLPRIFKEASPLCRVYIEWMISLMGYKHAEFRTYFQESFRESVQEQHPMAISIYERSVVLIAKQMPRVQESKLLTKFLVDVVVPSATSNRALTRHFSSSMAGVILNEITAKRLEIPPVLLSALENIDKVAQMAASYGRFRSGNAMLWDITDDLTLSGINGGVLLKISDREIDAIYEKSWKKYLSLDQRSILRLPIGHDQPDRWVKEKRNTKIKLDAYAGREEDSSMLQTKSGVWSTVMETDSNIRAVSNIKRSPLIVLASLVDKPPNIGGICRLCDCLGAGWMTVNDINVKERTEFLSVAVTAERWMPILEVNVDKIIEFLRLKKKKEGYTLVGLEQTDNSVELNSELKFPEKSLIVLGKEKNGIPANILDELDICVIIKQTGVVRSMNIQTATAVIVQAYSAQHC